MRLRYILYIFLSIIVMPVMANHHIDKKQQKEFIKDFSKFKFYPSMILTSNYVWRGVSQSANHPAMQGNFLLLNNIGVYTGLFGTNASFTGTNGKPVTSEFQLYSGYRKKIDNFNYDVGVRRYVYPNAIGPDFTEGYGFLGYRIFTIGFARSNEVPTLYGDSGTYHGTYYSAQALYQLPLKATDNSIFSNLDIGALIGRYNFSSSNLRDNSYTNYRLFVDKHYKSVTFELSWTDTNNEAAFIGQLSKSILAFYVIVCL